MHTLVRTLPLAAGVHELRVEYEQHGGAYNMRLEWAPPGGRARPLPPYRRFHERPDTDDVPLAYGVAWLERVIATLWIAVIGISLAWLVTLVWPRVGPQSTYGRYWASAFRLSAKLFRVAVAGPFGLPGYRGTGSTREESDPSVGGAAGYSFRGSGISRTPNGRGRPARAPFRGPRGCVRLALDRLRPPTHQRLDKLYRCRPQPLGRGGVGAERRRLQSANILVSGFLATLSGTRLAPATTLGTRC